MGRHLKNTEIEGGSYAIRLPVGTNSLGPDAPVDGQVRFNQSTNKVEFFYNGVWSMIAKIGTVPIVKDTFTTVDGQTQYGPMSYTYNSGEEANVIIFVGGVHQKPVTNYTFVGTNTTTVDLNPTDGTAGQTIIVLHNFNSTDAV
jgi:hypothetical protein